MLGLDFCAQNGMVSENEDRGAKLLERWIMAKYDWNMMGAALGKAPGEVERRPRRGWTLLA